MHGEPVAATLQLTEGRLALFSNGPPADMLRVLVTSGFLDGLNPVRVYPGQFRVSSSR